MHTYKGGKNPETSNDITISIVVIYVIANGYSILWTLDIVIEGKMYITLIFH